MDLYLNQKKAITDIIDDLFNTIKVRLLGTLFRGPKIYFEILKDIPFAETLEGLYRYSLGLSSGGDIEPDFKRLQKLSSILDNYIEAEKLKSTNKILVGVEGAEDINEVQKVISEQMDKSASYIETLMSTEVRTVQAYAEKDGIERLSAAINDSNPTVVKLGQVDGKLCEHCRNLWHTEENINVPKAYKLSELKGGYMDHHSPEPTLGPSHPRCRHVLSYVPPNFGFNNQGVIEFKGFGYDYYEDYWSKK